MIAAGTAPPRAEGAVSGMRAHGAAMGMHAHGAVAGTRAHGAVRGMRANGAVSGMRANGATSWTRAAWRAFPIWMLLAMGGVIAVNAHLIVLAYTSFPGAATNADFDTSNDYNKVLSAVRRQAGLGWVVRAQSGASPVLGVTDRAGAPLSGARVSGTARAALGPAPDRDVTFRALRDGAFMLDGTLPPGQWDLLLTVERGGQVMRITRRIVAP